jgi:uncharacterized protein YycO
MIDRNKFPLVYRWMIILLLLVESSCVSLQKNYLVERINLLEDQKVNFIPSEAKKNILQIKADSLLQVISEHKRQGLHLHASEINQLYAVFGQQLNNDRYYNEILQREKIDNDSLSPQQYLAALELLSSAENYQHSYGKNRLVRRTLNRGDRGNNIPRGVLWRSNKFLYDPSIRRILEKCILRYYNHQTDSIFNQLPETNVFINLKNRVFRNNDRIHSCLYNSAYTGSYVVGNTIGLFSQPTNRKLNADLLRSVLQPFDIVLMKSPHHLTDQFIPGYFGHVGIWFGNDLAAKLKGKVPVKDSIKGKAMVEVLRSGVKISTLRDFADGEIFLVIRPRKLSNDLKYNILSNTRKQLGKDYDFNFDIESPEAITCTELVFLAYDFVDWKTRYTWSRVTISPDDLVSTAMSDALFEFPVFIENGMIINYPDPVFIRSLTGVQEQLSNH